MEPGGDDDYDHLLKVVFVGDAAVGKSSILLRATEGQFDPQIPCTIGVDFKVLLMDLTDGLKVNLTIWDTGSYYRGAHGIFVVYDVSKRESWDHVSTWLNEVEQHVDGEVVRCLVGNKIDLERQVTKQEGEAFARQHKMLFVECSSKDDIGVNLLFPKLISAIIDNPTLAKKTRKAGANQDIHTLEKDQPAQAQPGCGC